MPERMLPIRMPRFTITVKTLTVYFGVTLLFVAAYSDVTTLQIPNLLVAAVALLGIIRLIVIGNIKFAFYTVGVSFLVFIAGTVIFAHGFIGGGDVKLITAVILLIGYRDSIRFLLLSAICGAVQYLIVVTAASSTFPLGVSIGISGSIILLIWPMSDKAGGEIARGRKQHPVDVLTSGNAVDVTSIDLNSVDLEPNPKLNFVSKHWRGEYSLPRSFWVHGVLLGYLLLVVSCVVMDKRLYAGSPFFSMIGMIGIGIWQIGGVWRSAKRQGGFWATTANLSIVVILLGFMANFSDALHNQLQRLKLEHQPASSTPPASPLIPADNKSAASTQPWKLVGEWQIRYDYLDAGDGTPSGCFMSRAYQNAALRIGIHGDKYSVIFTSRNLNARIEDRKHYEVSLSFGGFTPWSIKAEANTFPSGNKFLIFHASDKRFVEELISSNSVTISQSGTSIFEFTVTGAKEALAAMLNCQEAHRHNSLKSF